MGKIDLKELETAISQNNIEKITFLSNSLLKEYKKLTKRLDRIISQSDQQQREVLKLTEILEEKNQKLKTLLDNTSDGFLQFDNSMRIDSEYSKQVKNIFGFDVRDKDITTLLYKNSKKAKKLKENLLYILDNPQNQEIILSLLDKEFLINNKFINIEYKVLDNKFMLILTDITEKKELQKKAQIEKQILKMVVEVVVNKEESLELIKEYKKFINEIDTLTIDNIKRKLHTFKGLFSQKEFVYLPNKLHEIETTMNLDKKYLLKILDEDINILENILGKEFFKKDYLLIDKNRLNDVINKIKLYTNNSDIISLIESLTYFNLKNYFRKYQNLLNQLSLKFEKPIKIDFDIEDIYLDKKFKPFLDSLVHIFRNAIDHGIESIEERILNDKDEIGYIKCKVYTKQYYLIIEIEDDGRGIDLDKIKHKALEKGILNQDQLKYLDDIQISNLIFDTNFSTKDTITLTSGRGIGLNVVKDEIEKLNGYIKTFQNPTKFSFFIPLDIKKALFSFLKKSDIIKTILGRNKETLFYRKKNCVSIKIDKFQFFLTSDNLDKEILKESLNIIGGELMSYFSFKNLSLPYDKCLEERIIALEFDKAILSFKEIK